MRWLRDPLSHFLALGTLVFAAHRAAAPLAADGAEGVIAVEPVFVGALVRERAARTGGSEADVDAEALTREWIREEALVREARGLALDAGDLIIRRRLVQKLELLVRAGVEVPEPTDVELEAFLAAHADEYREPARVTFEHRFFSRDRRADRAVEDARAALEAPPEEAARGDAFPLGARVEGRDLAAVAETFGPELALAVQSAPIGAWSGPVSGRHGAHLVRVEARSEERPLHLGEVRRALRVRAIEEREQAAVEAALDAIVARYRVEEAP